MSSDRRPLDITYTGAPNQQRSMYDERLVTPMRRELTELGFTELRTAEEVDKALAETTGTSLVVVNSVCGCSARMARPAARMALANDVVPDRLYTVFAGQDGEATDRARDHFAPNPPSSPCFALMKDGELVWMLPRKQIEGRPATDIAQDVVSAFRQHCGTGPGA
jgi:putative YphP/YqiW family bacilliredoxin